MSAIEDLTLDFLLAIEMLGITGQGMPIPKIRHSISMLSPLGTDSAAIDRLAEIIVIALLTTGLVYQEKDTLYHMIQGGTPVTQYNPDDVTVN